jgi:class 3 adenylate cyclase
VHAEVGDVVFAEDLGDVPLHGFARPVRAYLLVDFKGMGADG